MERILLRTLVNCLAKVLRIEEPVAIPLTPPSGFASAVNLADMSAGLTSAGILACATLEQAASKSSIVSHSSSNTFKCSYVHPPGPSEDPRGALFKLVKNVALSNSTGTSGSNSNTSCVNGLTTCWGRLSCTTLLWGIEAYSPPSRRPNPAPCRQDTTSPWSTDYGKKQLNSDTNANNQKYLQNTSKKKRRNFFSEKMKKWKTSKNQKMKK